MTPLDADTQRKRASFRQLHARGCFVLPNPWDVGSAPAARLPGAGDDQRRLCLERRAAGWRGFAAGHAGPSAPDGGGDVAAVECRLRRWFRRNAAGSGRGGGGGHRHRYRGAVDRGCQRRGRCTAASDRPGSGATARRPCGHRSCGADVLLVGRAENFFVGVPDLEDTRRLRAYAEAGADVLYAPGISTREQIRAVVAAAGSTPVNLLVGDRHRCACRRWPTSACAGSAWAVRWRARHGVG